MRLVALKRKSEKGDEKEASTDVAGDRENEGDIATEVQRGLQDILLLVEKVIYYGIFHPTLSTVSAFAIVCEIF